MNSRMTRACLKSKKETKHQTLLFNQTLVRILVYHSSQEKRTLYFSSIQEMKDLLVVKKLRHLEIFMKPSEKVMQRLLV